MLGQEQIRRKPLDPNTQSHHYYSHSRTRTTSSSILPPQPQQPPHMQMQAPTPMHLQQPPFTGAGGHNRRSPSVNTFSTTSSNNPPQPPPAAFRTSPTADIRRSTSSRSGGGSGMSYVTLLRKQKATVWCDRAQYEDPRLLAQQRAAKQRANQEVFARASQGRTATGISSGAGKVAAKIRHHGKPGVVGYTPENNYIGVGGVPLRLSATEVEGEDSDDDTTTTTNNNSDHVSMQRLHHRRTGSSGRSSTTSGRRAASGVYRTSGGVVGPAPGSSGGGSGSGSRRWSPGDTPERSGSLATQEAQAEFQPGGEDKLDRPQSVRSGSSAEKADALPELTKVSAAKLASNSLLNAALTREKSVKNPEDLRRRGSVDERTMTLSSGRLFIANPD